MLENILAIQHSVSIHQHTQTYVNNMNNKIKLGLIFVILIILFSPTYALSFGTHVKNNKIDLY